MEHKGQIALKLQNVTVKHGAVTALQDFTLSVDRGDQIAILGPNGAGKSTLFDVITGLVKPSAGQVDVYGSQPNEHICIGYVPQSNKIDWRFPATVYDVVMMGRASRIGLFHWPSRRDRSLVMESLHSVDMADLAKRQIGELSGGQQQRVFLARALAQETHLLLLDEPLAGLDIPSQETILAILNTLQASGITMLVATHDLAQAAEHFPQVLLLNRQLIACGTPSHVLTHQNLVQTFGSHLHIVGQQEAGTPTTPVPTVHVHGAECVINLET